MAQPINDLGRQYDLYFYRISINKNFYSFRISRAEILSQLEILWQVLRKDLKRINSIINYRLISLALRELLHKINISTLNLLDVGGHEQSGLIVWYYLFRFYGLQDLFPLIVDGYITEIYIALNERIYVDHIRFGRLYTEVFVDKSLMMNLLLFLMFNADLRLIGIRPSSKTHMEVLGQKIRISVDITGDREIFVDMRKIPSYPPVEQYIGEKEQALLLLIAALAVVSRCNVLIFGEMNSGKTTLASILLDFLPNHWRLAVVEDVEEVPHVILEKKSYIRLVVSEFELRTAGGAEWVIKEKGTELLKLLHRSIDYLYVSELQDADDMRAFFQIISAGIGAVATVHARSFRALIKRLRDVYGIAPELLVLVDLYIEMERNIGIEDGKIDRKLRRIIIPLDSEKVPECIEKLMNLPSVDIVDFGNMKFFAISSEALPKNALEPFLVCILSMIFPRINCNSRIIIDALMKLTQMNFFAKNREYMINKMKRIVWSLASCMNHKSM